MSSTKMHKTCPNRISVRVYAQFHGLMLGALLPSPALTADVRMNVLFMLPRGHQTIMLPDFRVRQRDYLLEIARLLTQELDLEKLLQRILRVSIEMLAGQAGLIALKEPDGWRVAAADKIQAAFLSYLEPLLSDGKVRELDVRELNRMLKDLTYTASLGLLNGTGLPLSAHEQVIGVIFIFRNYADVFTANDRVLLQSFADQAAIAVFNARLYGQVNYEKQRLTALLDSAADGILILRADQTCGTLQRGLRKAVRSAATADRGQAAHRDHPLGARTPGHHAGAG